MAKKEIQLNRQQTIAVSLIQNDMRFLYTLIKEAKSWDYNYIMSAMPFIGVIVDGAEDWMKAYKNSTGDDSWTVNFTEEEQKYYEELRGVIKIWGEDYESVYSLLNQKYIESDKYFSNCCKRIAKWLKWYDIFGTLNIDGEYCGNTILYSCYIPQYEYKSSEDKKEYIIKMSDVAGKYIVLFNAMQEYKTATGKEFKNFDYGGFVKSPVGNKFSEKFVLFSLLCQLQFVLVGVEELILEECSTKLRIEYLQYYYTAKFIKEFNENSKVKLQFDDKWFLDDFRNAMAHYKVGVALKSDEIVYNDLLYGFTQKFFDCDYLTLKKEVIANLNLVANQIKTMLNL